MKNAVLYNKELERYSFGEGHPFTGERFTLFFEFFKSRFSKFNDKFAILSPSLASDEELYLVHDEKYIKIIEAASRGEMIEDIFKYVSIDNVSPLTGYIPRGIDYASRLIVGSAIHAAELIMSEKYTKVVTFGGAHHAKRAYGEGFCFYNDVAICACFLMKKYKLERILILDTDAHAGNGTKQIFYNDPKILFIDIHQDPSTIYPGEGFIEEIGKEKGEGFTINIPLAPYSSNAAYEYVFNEIVFPIAHEFKPQIIIRNGGSDPHYLDTLTNLGLTLSGFRHLGENVKKLANELTDGKCIDLILSGYNLKVIPFAWSSLIAGLLGIDVNLEGLDENYQPDPKNKLEYTRNIVMEIKRIMGKYWRCFSL